MAARDSSLGTTRDVSSARGHEADPSGLATPAEGAAWDLLRERNTVSLRLFGASALLDRLVPIALVLGLSLVVLSPDATGEALGVFLLFAGVSLSLRGSSTAAGTPAPAAVPAQA